MTRLLFRTGATAAMWLAVQLYYNTTSYAIGTSPRWEWSGVLIPATIATVLWTVLSPVTIAAARRLSSERKSRLITVTSLACLLLALSATAPFIHRVSRSRSVRGAVRYALSPQSLVSAALAIMFGYIVTGWEEAAAFRRRRTDLASQLMQLRVDGLRAALAPRLLYEKLASVADDVRSRPGEAEQAIVRFATLLRRLMSLTREESVPFERELDFIDSLLAITGETTLRVRADDDALEFPVPPLLVFGAISALSGGTEAVDLQAEAGGGLLEITVRLRFPGRVDSTAIRQVQAEHPRLLRLETQCSDSDIDVWIVLQHEAWRITA